MTPAVLDQQKLNVHRPNRTWDRVFFSLMILLLWGTVLFGFSRTYFLAGMVLAPLPNLLIHVHGAAFTLWMLLLLVQSALITTHQVRVHRQLGVAGFILAVLMVVLGLFAAADALRRGSGPLGLDSKTFFVIPITDMVLFSLFVFSAYRARFKPEAHKRLILIATIALMGAGIGRWPIVILQQKPFLQDFLLFGILLLIVGYDLLSLHRVSRTTLWASAVFVVVHLARIPLGMTPAWHALASRVIAKG